MNSKKVRHTIILVNLGILLLLAGTLWFSLFTIDRINSNLEIQVNTRTIIIALKDNLASVLNIENSERGFILSGDTSFLQSIDSSLADINFNISQLRSFIRDKEQQNNLALLQDFIYAKIASARELIELTKKNQSLAIQKFQLVEKDKHHMDEIQKLNLSMQKKEEFLFNSRKNNTSSSILLANAVFIIEGIFSILITIFLAVIIIDELNSRTNVESKLKKNNLALINKNKEIEQFAYVASHDLQEPLRSISNFTRLLSTKLKDHPDKDVRDYMGYVNGAAGRMSDLIFDLLEYSRIGRETEKKYIDCNKVVDEVLLDMDAAIKENNADINVQYMPMVFGYPNLKSLFQNLISNSIKFHRNNVNPVVEISATASDAEFIFTVKDNGIGIENEYCDKIFIIFQRLHTRSEFPGTGIGLAQCKKIVELHGGTIHVESEPGKGSSFIFTIPKEQ